MSRASGTRCGKRMVRHASDDGALPLGEAARCAACGVRYAFSSQRNFRIHAVFAMLAVALGLVLSIPAASWLAVVLCIVAVFALEVVNTAIESVVDMASPEWSELAMRAKDCAAGAVLIAATGSVVVAGIVYVPPAWECLSHAFSC